MLHTDFRNVSQCLIGIFCSRGVAGIVQHYHFSMGRNMGPDDLGVGLEAIFGKKWNQYGLSSVRVRFT